MSSTSTWLPITQLAEQLHCSSRSIYQFKRDGVFLDGIHFYSIGNGSSRNKCIYDLEACRNALLELTSQKAKQKAKASSIKRSETYDESHVQRLIAERK